MSRVVLETGCYQCSDVKILQKLLSSTALTHLSKPVAVYEYTFSEFMNKDLLTAPVSVWEPHRKAMSPAFSYKAFPTYLEFMTEASLKMINSARKLADWKSDGTIKNPEMKRFIDLAAVQAITNIIMGSNHFNVSQNELAKFHASFHRLKEIHLERFLRPELFISFIWQLHPKSKVFSEAVDECRKFINMIINMYRKKDENNQENQESNMNNNNLESGADENCSIKTSKYLTEHMMNSEMTNEENNGQVALFMAVGHETTVVAIDFLLFHPGKHPKVQKLCQEEVDSIFGLLGETGRLTMENLSQLKFLERCILESMRLTPVVPTFARTLEEDLKRKMGSVLEAGTILMVDTWSTHRDPEFYPDPEMFDHNRFLPENVKLRSYHSYLPFSLGPRNCIGWKIGLMEAKVIVAYILRNFVMTTTDNIDDVKIRFELTLKPERIYHINFIRRELN